MIPTDIAESCLRDHWELEGSLARLDGEQDANFRVTCTDGREFVLKVMHEGCDPDDLDFLVSALRHLEAANSRVPAVIPARDGTLIQTFEASGTTRLAWLTSSSYWRQPR